jgi:nucleotide-binding universal stress UspA family protein
MYARIAWLTDFSPNSSHCEGPVVALARAAGARVSVVHALSGLEALRGESEARLEVLAAPLRDQGLEVEVRLEAGTPADVAHAPGADLLVVGRTGKTGLVDRLLVGSTASRVLREATTDVLVVGGRPFLALRALLCAVEPPEDGALAPLSARPAARAAALALASDAEVTFLSVFSYVENVDSAEALAELRDAVRAVVGDEDFARLSATFEVSYAPSPEAGIVDVARDYDLVVMGHRSQSRLAQAVWGSVVGEVKERGPVPVLVVR